MKKSICILLSAMLLFMAAGKNLFAENIVGERGNTRTPYDGVTEMPSGTGVTTPISVAVVDTVSRYAVDLTYPQDGLVLSLDGDFVWNVNSHTYEGKGEVKDGLFVFSLTNHSDRPVYVYGEVTLMPRYRNLFAFTMEYTRENRLMIQGVRSGAAAGEMQNMTLSVKADGDSLGTLMGMLSASEGLIPADVTVGTFSIVISSEK